MVSDHLVEALDACDEPQLLHRDSPIKSKANSVRFPLACLAHNLLLHVADGKTTSAVSLLSLSNVSVYTLVNPVTRKKGKN